MKFNEAMDAVKRGKKVRRRSWREEYSVTNIYIWKPDELVVYNNGVAYQLTNVDMLAEDWEIAFGRMYFGSLMVKGGIVQIPEDPRSDGDMIGYNRPDIMIADTKPGFEISWLHLKDNIYICDRGLINRVSWNTLKEAGYVDGKEVTIDGKRCLIRLMTGSDGSKGSYGKGCDNEWDLFMDKYDEDNELTHYKDMYTWCKEVDCDYSDYRSIRGYSSARYCYGGDATGTYTGIAFRPAIEILNTEE